MHIISVVSMAIRSKLVEVTSASMVKYPVSVNFGWPLLKLKANSERPTQLNSTQLAVE